MQRTSEILSLARRQGSGVDPDDKYLTHCVHCSRQLSVKAKKTGKFIRCPSCEQFFRCRAWRKLRLDSDDTKESARYKVLQYVSAIGGTYYEHRLEDNYQHHVGFTEASLGLNDRSLRRLRYLALRTLTLTGPSVSDAGLEFLKSCRKLEALNFVAPIPKISGAGLRALEDLPRLKIVRFMNWNIRNKYNGWNDHLDQLSDLLNAISEQLSVEDLDLQGIGLDERHFRQLCRMRSLKEIQLAGCPIGDNGIRQLLPLLPQLSSCGFSAIGMTDAVIEEMRFGRELRSIDLRDNRISRLPLVELSWVLGRVYLKGTDIEPADVEHFEKDTVDMGVFTPICWD